MAVLRRVSRSGGDEKWGDSGDVTGEIVFYDCGYVEKR